MSSSHLSSPPWWPCIAPQPGSCLHSPAVTGSPQFLVYMLAAALGTSFAMTAWLLAEGGQLPLPPLPPPCPWHTQKCLHSAGSHPIVARMPGSIWAQVYTQLTLSQRTEPSRLQRAHQVTLHACALRVGPMVWHAEELDRTSLAAALVQGALPQCTSCGGIWGCGGGQSQSKRKSSFQVGRRAPCNAYVQEH